jgi:hypothetical protein
MRSDIPTPLPLQEAAADDYEECHTKREARDVAAVDRRNNRHRHHIDLQRRHFQLKEVKLRIHKFRCPLMQQMVKSHIHWHRTLHRLLRWWTRRAVVHVASMTWFTACVLVVC